MDYVAAVTLIAMLAEFRYALHRVLRRVDRLEAGQTGTTGDASSGLRPAIRMPRVAGGSDHA